MVDIFLSLERTLIESLLVDHRSTILEYYELVAQIDRTGTVTDELINLVDQRSFRLHFLGVLLVRFCHNFKLSLETLELVVLVLVHSLEDRVNVLTEELDLGSQLVICQAAGARIYHSPRASWL